MKPLTPAEALSWAAARCARSEHCRADLLPRLLEKGLPRREADAVLDQLEAEGYISPSRYARAFVHDHLTLHHWGRLKVQQALRLKGIPDAIIAEALAPFDDHQLLPHLRRLLASKAMQLKDCTPRERTTRLLRFAAGRGYETHLVLLALEEEE